MSNLTGYIEQLYHRGNESPGSSSGLDNTGAPWWGRCWRWGVRLALLQLRRLILVPSWFSGRLRPYKVGARIPLGSFLYHREAVQELIPLPSEASLAALKGHGQPDCPGYQENR